MPRWVCWVCGKTEDKCQCRRERADQDKELRKAQLRIHIREHPLGKKQQGADSDENSKPRT